MSFIFQTKIIILCQLAADLECVLHTSQQSDGLEAIHSEDTDIGEFPCEVISLIIKIFHFHFMMTKLCPLYTV